LKIISDKVPYRKVHSPGFACVIVMGLMSRLVYDLCTIVVVVGRHWNVKESETDLLFQHQAHTAVRMRAVSAMTRTGTAIRATSGNTETHALSHTLRNMLKKVQHASLF